VVGGALYASTTQPPAGALTLAMFAALATAWIGGWTMVKLRQRNAKWAERNKSGLDAGARGTVIGLQLRGMTADLVRGAFLTFAPLREASLSLWSVDARVSRAVAVGVAMSVAAAAAWKLFHGNVTARWFFAAGLAAGFAVMVLRWP
jgi:PTS system mannose-specific IIC component